jgi:hypothetical protein
MIAIIIILVICLVILLHQIDQANTGKDVAKQYCRELEDKNRKLQEELDSTKLDLISVSEKLSEAVARYDETLSICEEVLKNRTQSLQLLEEDVHRLKESFLEINALSLQEDSNEYKKALDDIFEESDLSILDCRCIIKNINMLIDDDDDDDDDDNDFDDDDDDDLNSFADFDADDYDNDAYYDDYLKEDSEGENED